jgi:hypothetical protein
MFLLLPPIIIIIIIIIETLIVDDVRVVGSTAHSLLLRSSPNTSDVSTSVKWRFVARRVALRSTRSNPPPHTF